jgi:hypothetical protein
MPVPRNHHTLNGSESRSILSHWPLTVRQTLAYSEVNMPSLNFHESEIQQRLKIIHNISLMALTKFLTVVRTHA